MADLTPNNREEFWLQGMVDGETTLTPNKRREYWYKEIVDAIGSGGGGGTGVLVATMDLDTGALDKTWQEILNSSFCVITLDYGEEGKNYCFVYSVYVDGGYKIEAIASLNNRYLFIAASASDYPAANMG